MADVELMIKIPEELKNKIDNANEDNYRTYIWWFETTLYCAIKYGTPLPKGHGRLIDADAFERRCMFDSSIEDMQDVIYALRDYKPIIEADKESE